MHGLISLTCLLLSAGIDPLVSGSDVPIVVTGTSSRQLGPSVTFDGTNFFVVWIDKQPGEWAEIYGARITPTGRVLDPNGILVTSEPGDKKRATVALAAGQYFVAWDNHRWVWLQSDDREVHAARVSTDGALLDSTAIPVGPPPFSAGAGLSCGPVHCLVSYVDQGVVGKRLDGNGAVLDASSIVISTDLDGLDERTDSAWNGASHLVVWKSSVHTLYGARVDATGSVLDPADLHLFEPAVELHTYYQSVASDGVDFLVASLSDWSDTTYRDAATIPVSRNGVPSRTGATLWASPGLDDRTFIASSGDAGQYLVGWTSQAQELFVARVDAAGVPLDQAPTVVGTNVSPDYFSAAGSAASDGTGLWLIAYSQDTNAASTTSRIVFRTVQFGPRTDGSTCTAPSDCRSGNCSDGVCCDTACGAGPGDCQACSVAAGSSTDGVCEPVASGTTCRESAGACDLPESCDGTSITCPADVGVSDGAACDDSNPCTADDRCVSTTCVGEALPDSSPCEEGVCAQGVCSDGPDAGVQADAGDLEVDAGEVDAGAVDSGATVDASKDAASQPDSAIIDPNERDAGALGADASSPSPEPGGCGCGSTTTMPVHLLPLAALAGLRRRRLCR